MGLFNKKSNNKAELSRLPELPRLPEMPRSNEQKEDFSLDQLPKLPSLPPSSINEKFSQDTIKDAIKGSSFDDFEDDEDEIEEIGVPRPRHAQQIPREINHYSTRTKKAEPVFIRLDKFEESMQIIEKAKKELEELQEMLHDTKKIKEEEEKELEYWENSIQNIKKEIEKIETQIFSKIE